MQHYKVYSKYKTDNDGRRTTVGNRPTTTTRPPTDHAQQPQHHQPSNGHSQRAAPSKASPTAPRAQPEPGRKARKKQEGSQRQQQPKQAKARRKATQGKRWGARPGYPRRGPLGSSPAQFRGLVRLQAKATKATRAKLLALRCGSSRSHQPAKGSPRAQPAQSQQGDKTRQPKEDGGCAPWLPPKRPTRQQPGPVPQHGAIASKSDQCHLSQATCTLLWF